MNFTIDAGETWEVVSARVIKAALYATGLSHRDIAAAMGIAEGDVEQLIHSNSMITGLSEMSRTTLLELMRAYGVSLLYDGVDDAALIKIEPHNESA